MQQYTTTTQPNKAKTKTKTQRLKKIGIFHPWSDPRQSGHPRRESWKKKKIRAFLRQYVQTLFERGGWNPPPQTDIAYYAHFCIGNLFF